MTKPTTTTTRRAFRIAIAALEDARRPLAFDANLCKRGIVESDRTRRAAAQYDELTEAIRVLRGEQQVSMNL